MTGLHNSDAEGPFGIFANVYLFHPMNVPGEVEYIGTKNINPPSVDRNPIRIHRAMNRKSM